MYVHGNVGVLQELGHSFDGMTENGTTCVIGVVVGDEYAGECHVIGGQQIEDALDVVGGVNHDTRPGDTITDGVRVVDHLTGKCIVRGDVAPEKNLTEIQLIGAIRRVRGHMQEVMRRGTPRAVGAETASDAVDGIRVDR